MNIATAERSDTRAIPLRVMKPIILCLAIAALLSGCMPYNEAAIQAVQEEDARLGPSELAYRTDSAVDRMLATTPALLQTRSPLAVGSIGDIRDMNSTSPLGNVIAELIRNRLVQQGLPVTDMRLRRTVALEPRKAEMALSRDAANVYPPPGAAEIVTGTYAVASNSVYVSLKMIEADNARILAAAGFQLPRTADIDRLLLGGIADAN